MKKATLRAALFSYSKDSLLPGLGKAYAVFVLAQMLVVEATKSSSPATAFDQVFELISKVGNAWHLGALAVAGGLFLVALLVKLYAAYRPPLRVWFKVSRLGGWFSIAVGVVAGTVIVPMTVWLAVALHYIDAPWYADKNLWFFVAAVVAYILVSFAIHWATIEQQNDAEGAMVWHLKVAAGNPQTDQATAALDRHFSAIQWLGKAEISSSSNDGHFFVEIPVLYNIGKWPKSDRSLFMAAYEARHEALKKLPFIVTGVSLSPSVKKLVEMDRKIAGRRAPR